MPDVDPSAHSTPPSEERGDASASDDAPVVPLGEGAVLAGRYRLDRLIGRGGMGAVWEAEHTQLGHSVAIKLIEPDLAGNERSRGRFLREARAAAALRSPYVVQIFDYGVEAGNPFIAMERLEGESLAERLRRSPRLSPHALVAILGQVARALDKAHGAGIVHRDLKPDNVFITRDDDGERCKVLDFGVAKVVPHGTAIDVDTNTGAMLGTPYYMSPEQATDASEVGPPSDLWSMAVIAYECLVGERPFDGATLPALSVKLLAEPVPIPSEHGDVPAGFDAWFARATQRDPAERFGSASEMVVELAAALRVDAPSVSMTMAPPPTESRRSVAIGGALVVALAVFGGWSWWSRHREPPNHDAEAETPAEVGVASPPAVDPPAVPLVAADVPAPPETSDPETVELRLRGPDGARVYRGETLLGTLPEPISLPRGDAPVTLRITADGYREQPLDVRPTADRTLEVELHKVRKGSAPSGDHGETSPPAKSNVDDLEF